MQKSVEGKTDELENRERNRFNKSEKGFSVKLRDAKTRRHTRNVAAKENTNVKLLINDVVNVYGAFNLHTKLLPLKLFVQVRRLNNQTFGSSVISKASNSNVGKPKKLMLLTKQIVRQSYKGNLFSFLAALGCMRSMDADVAVLVWPRMSRCIKLY